MGGCRGRHHSSVNGTKRLGSGHGVMARPTVIADARGVGPWLSFSVPWDDDIRCSMDAPLHIQYVGLYIIQTIRVISCP